MRRVARFLILAVLAAGLAGCAGAPSGGGGPTQI